MIKDIKKYQSEGLQPEGKDADRVSIDLRRGNKATPKSLLAGFLCHRLRIYAQTTTDPNSTFPLDIGAKGWQSKFLLP